MEVSIIESRTEINEKQKTVGEKKNNKFAQIIIIIEIFFFYFGV